MTASDRALGITHVITGLSIGGAEQMLLRVASSLAARGWPQQVISLEPEGAIGAALRRHGISVHSAELTRSRDLSGAWRRLRAGVRMGPADVIHGWMYHGNLAALAAARLTGVNRPVLWSIRQSLYSLEHERRGTAMVIRLGARLSRLPNAILYNSRTSAEQHGAFGYRNAHVDVIPNGFDTDVLRPRAGAAEALRRAHGWPDEAVVVGLVARYHVLKNHAGFLRAAAPLVRAVPSLRLLLVGREVNDASSGLGALCAGLGIADRVGLVGEVANTAEIMAGLDVLCSASIAEGFPNVVGEAMACGVPCVVTDVGDSASVVGDAGLVVPLNELAIGAGLEQMVGMTHEQRTELGGRARNRIVSEFSLPAVVDRYAELYQAAHAGRLR